MINRFTLYPAIDLRGGKVVRLFQGDFQQETVFGDPLILSKQLQDDGAEWIHLVDLEGAKAGYPVQKELILQLAKILSLPIQIGGGIRSLDVLKGYLEGGVQRVILGTAVIEDKVFVQKALNLYGDRIVIGLDARKGMAATQGWLKDTDISVFDLAKELVGFGATTFIYTDIAKDGTLTGPNTAATVALAEATGANVIASGGISKMEDILELRSYTQHGIKGAILGKSLYTGTIVFRQALQQIQGEEVR